MQLLSSVVIDKLSRQAVYLQIANQLMSLIRKGTLPSGYRLMSTRQLASMLNVHRRTVVLAYDELLAQGWLESHVGNGTFVAKNFPEIKLSRSDEHTKKQIKPSKKAGFEVPILSHLNRSVLKSGTGLHLDDGFPDARLAPLEELSRAYRSQLLTGNSYARLGYGDTHGSLWLRQELSVYLNETRGLNTTIANILIVRGTIMGLYLVSAGLLKPGDNVVVSELGWAGANNNFLQAGANLLTIPSDDYGIDLDALEKLCLKQPIRLLYVTSHHHYPTTVALRADRRVRLLQLAEQFGFIIFEDDYDYDFHYLSKPLLPLAGADQAGMVLYCGSFTKAISPVFRVGYLVGPENAIAHLAKLRRIIDRQGDTILENALADLLQNGVIQRHLRKSLRVYRQRRDLFCELLNMELENYVEFQVPDGGMAVWTKFDQKIDLPLLAQKALKKDLYFSDGSAHQQYSRIKNTTRLGFASSDPHELEKSVTILKNLI
ncbi:PLP-dependent aminotransferase family protein [Dyadobacter sp. NIV53]|uniref:aminotransferase-like domain-containing protein n=1 Tax=Dyadobacter sp. NIV53 TaxID=2861765 RepID=UPI001E580BCA|nr:PLP-dependent aminotransferase family protein [Dyadobacter sp. NIV53]